MRADEAAGLFGGRGMKAGAFRCGTVAACLLALTGLASAQTAPDGTTPAQAQAPSTAAPGPAPQVTPAPSTPQTAPASPPPAAAPAEAQLPPPPKPPADPNAVTPMPGMPTHSNSPAAQPLPSATPAPDGQGQTVFSGEGAVLSPVAVAVKSGQSSWDEGYDSIVAALNAVQAEMDKLGLKAAGDVMVVYTQSDDAGFEFEAQIPYSGTPSGTPGKGIKLAQSFNGKALKFPHRGSFADMDDTYEQIANFLDSRNLTALDLYIEQYHTDPRVTAPDQLVVDILVPVR